MVKPEMRHAEISKISVICSAAGARLPSRARGEPRSGRRPVTAKPSEGYVSALRVSVFSTASATALLQFR